LHLVYLSRLETIYLIFKKNATKNLKLIGVTMTGETFAKPSPIWKKVGKGFRLGKRDFTF